MSSENMDRLIRISLVNWYLFDAIDIAIEGDSTLFRGLNGVGKSSILDAFQVIFSGADENLMLMNAASSDGKRSGRTLRSYALGEVAESPGHAASEPRQESNTFLSLTFARKQGAGYYSFGVAIYAQKNASNSLKKNHFLLDGGQISAADFKLDENTVMTWKMFEQKLMQMEGRAGFANTATEYRDKAAELMSAKGARNLIASDMMFRAIKNGLAFKEESSMTDFCRKHILPESNIDVLRIQNDFHEFTKIQETIKNAKERFSELTAIIRLLQRWQSTLQLALGYEWTVHESVVSSTDLIIETLEDQQEQKESELIQLQEREKTLKQQEPDLQKQRDQAMIAWQNSAGAQAIQDIEREIESKQNQLSEFASNVQLARKSLGKLEQAQAPASLDPSLSSAYEKLRKDLEQSTGMTTMEFSGQWPANQGSITKVQQVLSQYALLLDDVSSQQSDAALLSKDLKKEINELHSSLEKMKSGKASLTRATEGIQEELALAGIQTIPVCNVAEISDPKWQFGIESFLGGNRESLVIVNGAGKPITASADIDQAIATYRKIKKQHPDLGRAKLINPEKVAKLNKNQVQGYAAGLIKSDNKVALHYLTGLLKQIDLVETESELRQSNRAITPDGMVASNGTIGGGNRIHWLLIGEKARRESAKQIAEALKARRSVYEQQEKICRELNELTDLLKIHVPELIKQCDQLSSEFDQGQAIVVAIDQQAEALEAIKNSPDAELKQVFELADQTHADNISQQRSIAVDLEKIDHGLKKIREDIETKHQKRIYARDSRRKIEQDAAFDAMKANQCLEGLEESLGDDQHQEIQLEANKRAERNRKDSNNALDKGKTSVTAYAVKHNTPDREELSQMAPNELFIRIEDHAQRIEETELINYEADAEQAQTRMLQSFRSEVVAKLKENFLQVDNTFHELNHVLKDIVFNENKYQFKHPVVDIPSLKDVYEYAINLDEVEANSTDGLFATAEDHPAIQIIQALLIDGRLHEISDYRNFFTYELYSKSTSTDTERAYAELLTRQQYFSCKMEA